MTGIVGCIGLCGIAVFIIALFWLTRKNNQKIASFYAENSLVWATDGPQVVIEAIGTNGHLSCLRGSLTTASGCEVPFHWWEWSHSSTIYAGGAPRRSFTNYLAVSFAPGLLSDDFEERTIATLKSNADTGQKLKDAFVINTHSPLRAEKLADGSFLIVWQVTEQAHVLKERLDWLKGNVSKRDNIGREAPIVIAAEVKLVLMMIQLGGDFAPSEPMTYQYFILASETFAADLAGRAKQVIMQVYDEHLAVFKLREPNDANYISVAEVSASIVTPDKYEERPWLSVRSPAWESSNCIVVENDGYRKVAPTDFSQIIGLVG